ncbi:MAG: aminotransferase class III-fold pyridoxal phosphate-dependent enzyme [Candidatus Dadabacteria bacterium]|nr:MAG: aminotransferase class III-fold pyridoxal phosphate-dependent enzyme [Candidatus Dadabacteria bacterium]
MKKRIKGRPRTVGLSESVIRKFLDQDPKLGQAIERASEHQQELLQRYPEISRLGERELQKKLQEGILNFYPDASVSTYIPAAARGPWVISLYGAVSYDTGGYGMLGLGHHPEAVFKAMSRDHVMANVMTPSFSQYEFVKRLQERIGERRGNNPYQQYVFMNSGSEAMTVAARVSDIHAKVMTDPGAKYEGREIKVVGLSGGFHGRTYRPARASDSTRKKYQVLASFRDYNKLLTVRPNDVNDLKRVFNKAYNEDNQYIEAMFMEPVMGEGNPGESITPEFYAAARELTCQYDSYLIIDSIQAGLRCQGVLSIVDYPGFENLEPPDMESFSKAVNAGQFPLSVLALRQETASVYQTGVYGNTMTSNPRALDVGCAVLDSITPELRDNIVKRGKELKEGLLKLKDEFPGMVTKVQGTGLLASAELDKKYSVVGFGGVEEWMRVHGLNVIHGGANSLRYTPHFGLTSDEVALIVDITREALESFCGQA